MTSSGDGKHCAPERRVPKIQGTWVTLCGCYSDDCPQLAYRADGMIGIRKSSDPGQVVWFDAGEVQEFLEAVRDPGRDVLAEARDAFEYSTSV